MNKSFTFFGLFALLLSENAAYATLPVTPPPLPDPPGLESEPLHLSPTPVAPPKPASPMQFMSTVQFAIHESHPQIMQRSQRLVMEQMNHTLAAWPELQNRRYEIRQAGNEIIFYLVANEDTRVPMQEAVAALIQNLNGRVRARGRSLYYRTSSARPIGGYLEVVVNDVHSKVHSVAAQSVPLRDLLKELKAKLGNLSYLIPGECADRLIDWSFGNNQLAHVAAEAKSVDAVMSELATLFDLKCEKKNGTYIFTGGCRGAQLVKHAPSPPRTQMLNTTFLHNAPIGNTQVYFPLSPIGE